MKSLKEIKLLKLKELIATRKGERFVFVINEEDLGVQFGIMDTTFNPWFTIRAGFLMTHTNYCIDLKTQRIVTQIMEIQNEN